MKGDNFLFLPPPPIFAAKSHTYTNGASMRIRNLEFVKRYDKRGADFLSFFFFGWIHVGKRMEMGVWDVG